MMTTCSYESAFGPMLLAAKDGALFGAWFLGQKHFPEALIANGDAPSDGVLARAARECDAYAAGERRTFGIPLAPRGTPWQRAVWQALLAIAYGETLSYGELAARLGRPGSARAVGAAVGRNPLSIFIPCHRVVGANGSLTGYAGGLDRKRALLVLEKALPER
ncbi:methylated-DNA--[protein]-cysteine S-methyltransferase [Solidesulfovibrio sp.]|jgi:methylated-DNA-[protein]-cysteine S-methyltransferase|uniref:methylated-DNA--[protein]-cysteine S-methyltransferase n=1 Tax=Solidesulfovibrio sp. TaxID=2910990 RepID=UPI002B1F7C4C|nr:methylated-DNA--[protein]-cysteine S-methyltransferase [Solidesulfovibrio sp.]MEA5088528.1 methylated-DNA--[protein]-cysteine S-methyltransferase [Solidesulfovibrio sp.]HML62981.1 methylated-DNA--[protein]-cysteine S-methyltransferase [Solidesulfovibrio sp.]